MLCGLLYMTHIPLYVHVHISINIFQINQYQNSIQNETYYFLIQSQ